MAKDESWSWGFLAFGSDKEPEPVEVWFRGLPYELQEEVLDILAYLQHETKRKWREPVVQRAGWRDIRN